MFQSFLMLSVSLVAIGSGTCITVITKLNGVEKSETDCYDWGVLAISTWKDTTGASTNVKGQYFVFIVGLIYMFVAIGFLLLRAAEGGKLRALVRI